MRKKALFNNKKTKTLRDGNLNKGQIIGVQPIDSNVSSQHITGSMVCSHPESSWSHLIFKDLVYGRLAQQHRPEIGYEYLQPKTVQLSTSEVKENQQKTFNSNNERTRTDTIQVTYDTGAVVLPPPSNQYQDRIINTLREKFVRNITEIYHAHLSVPALILKVITMKSNTNALLRA